MKAIIHSLLLETKVGLIRNLLFVVISALLVFFEVFTDFPFIPHAQAQEHTSKDEQLLDIMVYWIILLAIFRQCVLGDLDNRTYFAQHPLNYKSHFIGKCIFLCLIFIVVDLLVFAVHGFCGLYYSHSLGVFTLNTYTDRLVADIAGSLFSGGFILLISLFRPLHFALLIVIVTVLLFWLMPSPTQQVMSLCLQKVSGPVYFGRPCLGCWVCTFTNGK